MKIWTFTICMILAGAFSLRADTMVTVDTSALNGTSAQIAFDFIDGGSPSNSVTISGFTTDGTLGSNQPPSGGVSGTLPGTVVLTDSCSSCLFNEYLRDITLGSTFSFDLSVTTNPPDSMSFPDAFSLFLLDSTESPLFPTTDPTGSNSLLTLNIDGSAIGDLSIYDSSVSTAPANTTVPEPCTLLLMGTGLLLMLRKRMAH